MTTHGPDGARTDVVGCLACGLTAGRAELPGGVIHAADGWRIEHAVAPLGLGTLLSPAQTYVCLWSHAGGAPGHIHYVVQPVTDAQVADGILGPFLQVEMFRRGVVPDADDRRRFADRARTLLAASRRAADEPRRR